MLMPETNTQDVQYEGKPDILKILYQGYFSCFQGLLVVARAALDRNHTGWVQSALDLCEEIVQKKLPIHFDKGLRVHRQIVNNGVKPDVIVEES